MINENELIDQIKKGNKDSIEILFDMYYEDILRYCIWHTPDRQTAEDATQDTFVKVFRHIDGYQHRGYFKAFVYKVAANTCRNLWRKQKDVQSEGEGSYVDEGLDRVESDEGLRLLIQELPEQQREIVMLRFSQDLKMREIGMVLELPLRTVQSRLRAALKKIKKDISGRCLE